MSELLPSLAIILTALIGAGFFAGYETGIYCLNGIRLRMKAARGDRAAKMVLELIARRHHIIATILLGTNVCVYIATGAMTALMAKHVSSHGHAEVFATLILAPIFFVFAEVIPKNIFRSHADTMVLNYRWPAKLAHVVLSIPAAILSAAGASLGSLGSRKSKEEINADNLLTRLSEAREHGYLSHFQDNAVLNVLDLSKKTLGDVMIPIEKVVAAPETSTVGDIRKLMSKKCFSRVPLFADHKERVMGFVHIFDLPIRGGDKQAVRPMRREAFRLSSETPIHAALATMQSKRKHIVMVAEDASDVQADTLGIATIKDIVEEIVGELAAW